MSSDGGSSNEDDDDEVILVSTGRMMRVDGKSGMLVGVFILKVGIYFG
jgi:hypothetical protein